MDDFSIYNRWSSAHFHRGFAMSMMIGSPFIIAGMIISYHVAWPTWPRTRVDNHLTSQKCMVWYQQRQIVRSKRCSTIKWWGNPHPSSQNWNTSGRLERVHPPYMFCLFQVCPELKAMNDGELCADSNRWFPVEAVPLWWRVICLIAIQVFESTWFTDALFKAFGLYGHDMTYYVYHIRTMSVCLLHWEFATSVIFSTSWLACTITHGDKVNIECWR